MRRLLSGLGVVGLLAAASLVHPGVASAQPPPCQNAPNGGAFDFFISEIQAFATSNPEVFICVTPQIETTFTLSADLVELNNVPPQFPDSDSVFGGTGTTGFSVITLASDGENGILGTAASLIPEQTMACGPGGLPDPAGEPTNTCNGAVITGIPFVDPLNPNSIHTGTLTVISDVVTAVPEPSTGLLLLGGLLPALVGLRMRSVRVRA